MLKLFRALNIKAVDDNSSQFNTVNILLRMSLNEFVVNMSKVMDKQVRPYLMLRVDRLRIDSSVTEYGYASHATLGGIQLVDKIHVGEDKHSPSFCCFCLCTSSFSHSFVILHRRVEQFWVCLFLFCLL